MNIVNAVLGLAALLLAVVAAFIAIPDINLAAILVVLGIVVGATYSQDNLLTVLVSALVYPLVAVALGNIPAIGLQLGQVATNVGLVVAGVAAAMLAVRLFGVAKGNVATITKKA